MAKIDKSALTRAEIIREASKQFLEKGYTNTTVSSIAKELEMSPGNLTFHFPTKEHLLAELVDMLCDYQWKLIEREADYEDGSIMAICLELTTMTSACEDDDVIKDFFISSYSSPLCLDIIRKNDTKRSKKIFKKYQPEWTDEKFSEAEILVSGIEYATLMTVGNPVPLETRISGALHNILGIYGVPEEIQNKNIEKVFSLDYKNLCKQVLKNFKKHVAKTNEQMFRELLNR